MKKLGLNDLAGNGLKQLTLVLFLFSISIVGKSQEKSWLNSKLEIDARISALTVGNASPGERSLELGAKAFKIEVNVN